MKDLIKKLLEDNSFEVNDAETLRNELDFEMQRDKPDIDLINEIVNAIAEAENFSERDTDIEAEYRNITNKVKRKPILRFAKGFAATACVVLVISNVITYSTYGENLYTLVTKNEDKIHFDFLKSEEKNNNSFEYDEYGIKKCFENLEMKVESPMYFPEGFEITEKRLDEHLITLSDGVGQIDISFMELNRGLTVDGVNPNETVIKINGNIATYINDDNADWLIYKFDDIVAIYDFQNISDEEIDKIISSIE